MKIRYIGYWVECVEHAIILFKMLGYKKKSEIFYDKRKDSHICFMESNNMCIKLIEPASDDSIMQSIIAGHEKQDYHICYETDAFEQDVLDLFEKGFELLSKEHEENYFEQEALFLSNKKLGLIELLKAV